MAGPWQGRNVLHKIVDCREPLGEGPFGPVFYLRCYLVVRRCVETGEKGVYLFRQPDTAILVRHGRERTRGVAGAWNLLHPYSNSSPLIAIGLISDHDQ